jgi:peptide deformylase
MVCGGRIMELVKFPNNILTKPTKKVAAFDEALHKELDTMLEIMNANNGMGLAANQVGLTKSMFIMKDKQGNIIEFVNPKIVERAGNQMLSEGCLSAPGVSLTIPRSEQIYVEAYTRNGEQFQIVATGMESVCIQHEFDHLQGIFFLSKANRQQRRAALSQLGIK